jgi:hypothetical protein
MHEPTRPWDVINNLKALKHRDRDIPLLLKIIRNIIRLKCVIYSIFDDNRLQTLPIQHEKISDRIILAAKKKIDLKIKDIGVVGFADVVLKIYKKL